MSDFSPQETPFTGRKMLLIIVSFFGVIIAVNGTMLTLAVQTFGGLVVRNSYVASQSFNDDIAAARAQPIAGWSVDAETTESTVTVYFNDKDGKTLRYLDLTFNIARPTHERSTITIPLIEKEPGVYTGNAVLEAGQWLGTIVTADGQTRSLIFSHVRSAP